jgi:hypothetical protein
MKKSILVTSLFVLASTCIISCSSNTPTGGAVGTANAAPEAMDSVKMDGDIIARQEVNKLYTQLDFQQACQAYLWSVPLVSFVQWQYTQENVFGAKSGDIVLYTGYANLVKILTANATTPYLVSFIDMAKDGAFIVELPSGNVAGGLADMWQQEIAALGEMGADKGKSAKYLLLPPEGKDKDLSLAGYTPVKCSMNNIFLGLRVLDPDPSKMEAIVHQIKIYPYATRSNPSQNKVLTPPPGKDYVLAQPAGLEYWQRLHDIIQEEPVQERNMFYMAMLQNLGIEKGKPFNPTDEQKKALSDGAKYGEMMAQAITYDKRFPGIKHWSDRNWEYVITMDNAAQRSADFEYLLQRTAYFYEAVTFSKAMISKTPGQGQAYLGTYRDKNDNWLDGARAYTLHVPANPPAAHFWSLTVYDAATRCLIVNDQKNADLSSRKDLVKNADGSFDLYFSPQAPPGKEKNWVQTVPGKHWFAYFRCYGPTEKYFDKSWQLDDIAELK